MKSAVPASGGSLKWKYGSKDRSSDISQMEFSPQPVEVSTSEEEASCGVVQRRWHFDPHTMQGNDPKDIRVSSSNAGSGVFAKEAQGQSQAKVRDPSNKCATVSSSGVINGNANNIPGKRESLSLAERRRQFESCGSLTHSSGSNRESSEREVVDSKDRLSSVRDLQERFERQSVERDDVARSSLASASSYEGATNGSSNFSRSSVFGDSSYQTGEDDRSWNTIL